MKPESGNAMASREEVTLDKAYETIGLLVAESRLPDVLSSKGRRDGIHLQLANKDGGNTTVHKCTYDDQQCAKVRKYREIMAGLCRNGIPLCIEVLLCPECELGTCSCLRGHNRESKSHDHEVRVGQSNSYVLLEQWTIQQVYKRSEPKADTIQNLVQAVRSQLCFSQLSAWFQSSKGDSPKHVFYRLTAPGEWFVHKFVMSPQSHTFPDAALSKGLCCRVTMSSLPRMTMTPYEISLANRDQLFAVKDASPPLKKSHSSFSSLRAATCDPSARSGRLSLCHSSKANRRSPLLREPQQDQGDSDRLKVDDGHVFNAQRCLLYTSKEEAGSSCHLPSVKLPDRTVNDVKLNETEQLHRKPPTRLPISSQTTNMPLKSPKVLFTRTKTFQHKDFFPVPSIDDSLAASTDVDSDTEIDKSELSPTFMVGDDTATNGNIPIAEPEECNASISAIDLTEGVENLDLCPDQTDKRSKTEDLLTQTPQPVVDDNTEKKILEPQLRSRKSLHEASNNSKLPAAFPQFMRSRLFKKQLPSQSSPAPVKRLGSSSFDYDASLSDSKSIKSAISCSYLNDGTVEATNAASSLILSSSAPALFSNKGQTVNYPPNNLLGNFEESLLNGRIEPAGVINGFTVDIGASGSFCPKHVKLPVAAYFFSSLSDDNAPSPYLRKKTQTKEYFDYLIFLLKGFVDLSGVSKRGYQVPRKGTLQLTLFYPNDKVNKMFVVSYDLWDMPARSQTFIRQKTVYAPCDQSANSGKHQNGSVKTDSSANSAWSGKTYLRYLIHLRFRSTKSNKIFLHTDIRLIYARDKFEFDSKVAAYELRSFIEAPTEPKYSPIK